MEFCQGGDLSQLLKKCRKEKDYISEDVIKIIIGNMENHDLNNFSPKRMPFKKK